MSGEAVSLFSKNRILDFDFNISFYFSAHCNILKQSEIALRLAPGANTMYRMGFLKKKKARELIMDFLPKKATVDVRFTNCYTVLLHLR